MWFLFPTFGLVSKKEFTGANPTNQYFPVFSSPGPYPRSGSVPYTVTHHYYVWSKTSEEEACSPLNPSSGILTVNKVEQPI